LQIFVMTAFFRILDILIFRRGAIGQSKTAIRTFEGFMVTARRGVKSTKAFASRHRRR